jgi:recombination protein RecR
MLPKALEDVIEQLRNLPGVGPRSAERYALSLLNQDPSSSRQIADALNNLHRGVGRCQTTFVFVEPNQTISTHYTDPKRDKQTVVVVADPLDAIAIEKTGEYNGTYHVLNGLMSPIDGVGPEQLTIPQLIKRIGTDEVKELILATNASVEGESTAMYIKQQLGGRDIQMSRLARGIPVGVDIEYTDQVTLSRALSNRQHF